VEFPGSGNSSLDLRHPVLALPPRCPWYRTCVGVCRARVSRVAAKTPDSWSPPVRTAEAASEHHARSGGPPPARGMAGHPAPANLRPAKRSRAPGKANGRMFAAGYPKWAICCRPWCTTEGSHRGCSSPGTPTAMARRRGGRMSLALVEDG